jgi:DNA-binding Lrp family transcriptional regulator
LCPSPQNESLSGPDMKAYVFITAAPGRSTDVVNALRRINGVRSADICWGLPDIVALVEAADGPALQDLVLYEIQKTAGVTQTDTHIVFG